MTFTKGNKVGRGWRNSMKRPRKATASKYKAVDEKTRNAYRRGKTPWIPEQ